VSAKTTTQVAAAAIKIGAHQFTGTCHFLAAEAAAASGVLGDENAMDRYWNGELDAVITYGFVTNAGEFLTREEAFNLAVRNGQLTEIHDSNLRELAAEDLRL
jgi:hypothetical protein